MALWPSNSAQTISAAGYAKFARRTQLTGFVSYGFWSNDEPLQPFTINPTLPQIALPRATTEAEAHVFSTNLEPRLAPANATGSSAPACGDYDYDNQIAAHAHPAVHQLRHVGQDVVDRRAGAVRAQPHELRCRRDLDADCGRWP